MEEIKEKNTNILATSILIAAVVVGGSFVYGAGLITSRGDAPVAQVGNTGGPSERSADTINSNVSIDDDVILGDPDAPVTIVEFGDYQCPFCARLVKDTNPRIRDEYITTGKVRKVFKHFPLDQIHPNARPAAEAAECAKEQGEFWIYHEALFVNQADLSTLNYAALAGDLGMDRVTFQSCIDTNKYAAEVEADYQDGLRYGVTGTPGTFINGRLVSGALPFEQFKIIIEEELAKAEQG